VRRESGSEPPPKRTNAPAWKEAPPARRETGKPAEAEPAPAESKRRPRTPPRTDLPADDPDRPTIFGPGTWEAPPVRSPEGDGNKAPGESSSLEGGASPWAESDDVSPLEEVDEEPSRDDHPAYHEPGHAPRGRLAKWIIVPFLLLALSVVAGGGYLVWITISQKEENLAKDADDKYASGLFRAAAQGYAFLVENYPDSDNLPRYKFRQELADIRHRVSEKPESPGELLDRIEQFIKDYQKDPLLSADGGDVAETLIKLLVEYCEGAENPTDEEPLKVLARAAPVLDAARRIKLPKDGPTPDWSKVESAFACVQQAVTRLQQKKRILVRLEKVASDPSWQAFQAFEAIVKEEERNLPGLSKLPEVQNLIRRIYDGHIERIRYVRNPAPVALKGGGEVANPAILFDPLIQGTPGNAPVEDRLVLALARGLLYALKQSNGQVKWAMRVGIDTTALPVQVPARAGSRERILVLSTDTSTLTALDTDANPLWHYRLGAPCLGKPIVVDQRAYLATYDGKVHEIELVEGKLLGTFDLGQRLTLGGTLEPGSKRIYFPADEGCVYVIDVGRQKCDMILYTHHPGGSLRGEPVIVPPEGEDSQGFLILAQTTGLSGVQLRVFDLPITDRHAPSRTLKPKAGVQGWTWFPPSRDAEKLVMLSDTGVLGLFGIKQLRNRDQALFPLLPEGGLQLRSLLGEASRAVGQKRGRAEVVSVQGDDLWVLGVNHLQRLHLGWVTEVGPRVVPAWKEALEVGSPLHHSQVVEDRLGRMSLILVTQPPRRSTAWATSVNAETGAINWRRQLGLVCARAPVLMPGGPPLFLALDQGGALFSLDPARYPLKADTQWLSDNRNVFLAGSLDENPNQEPMVLRSADGQSCFVVACPRGGRNVVVRHVTRGADGRLRSSEGSAELPAPLGGTPAVMGDRLLLPLTNGVLARVPLALPPMPAMPVEPESGPDWRSARAVPDSRGHAVSLDGDRFLTTDGGRGLKTWEWPVNGQCNELPAGGEESTLELRDRIVSAPLRLLSKPGAPVQVCVADSAGNLFLFEVQGNGALVAKRRWQLTDKVATREGGIEIRGPYLLKTARGMRVACVVEQSRLVWIDPRKDGILWKHETAKGDGIIGQPQVAEGMVVVADQSGLYVGLDPVTGKPLQEEGYRLRGSVAPVASPVSFGQGRLLAPLSDGTVMLLAAERLRKK
jgi:outer membrane protein assembly factor BamB